MTMPNPWALVAALLLWFGTAAGVWFYRGHIDSTAVLEAQERIEKKYALAAEQAQKDAETKTLQLQAQADSTASTLQLQLDAERKQHAQQLAASRAALKNLPACPVPIADVGVLLQPQGAIGDAKGGPPADAGRGAPGGTVDASTIIATCEVNKGAFDRNLARLQACIGLYDSASQAQPNDRPAHTDSP
jgi:hypothetical protein